MRNRFTLIALVALLCFSTSIQMTCAEPEGKQVPTVYFMIKDAAEARESELLYLLDEDLSPIVFDYLLEGLDEMKLAENAEDPQVALEHYMNALKCFRETMSNYLVENEDTSTNILEPVIDPIGPPEPEDLDEEIKENTVRLISQFQEKIEEKFAVYYDEVEEIIEFLPEDAEEFKEKIERVQDKIEKVKERSSKGELKEAVKLLDEDLDSVDEDLDYLDEKTKSKTNRKIEKMEEKERREKEEKERKAKKDKDDKRDKKPRKPETDNKELPSNNGKDTPPGQEYKDSPPENDPPVENKDTPPEEDKKTPPEEDNNDPPEQENNTPPTKEENDPPGQEDKNTPPGQEKKDSQEDDPPVEENTPPGQEKKDN